ncbi:hypothetical protein [Rhodococcus sp. NPDC127528]|uniref:hypothetical protein n=1 Tax=unclassified Rhodococcus (in: high G+C Gram-positive bacteria) TaxID=192944 RepID=UPI0036355DB4
MTTPLPPTELASDVDGSLFVIVDPNDADMSGWSLEITHENGTTSRSPFTQQTWYATEGGGWNGLGYGTATAAWCAPARHGSKITAWIGPDGIRRDN